MILILLLILVYYLYNRYQVQGNIEADRVKVIRKWNRNTVTWEEFFDLYDFTIKYDYEILMRPPGFFVFNEGHLIEKVNKSLKKIKLHTWSCIREHHK
jgi:hypothetical protein